VSRCDVLMFSGAGHSVVHRCRVCVYGSSCHAWQPPAELDLSGAAVHSDTAAKCAVPDLCSLLHSGLEHCRRNRVCVCEP
jgi:hypothetical protein